MNRPWLYADELIDRFATYQSKNALRSRLKKCYPVVAEIEEIAIGRGIVVREVFQGSQIGAFTVMSPTKAFYLDLVVESEKTPEVLMNQRRVFCRLLKNRSQRRLRF